MIKKKTYSKISLITLLVVGALCFSEISRCNQYKELSLVKKVERSDLILIIKVISVTSKNCIEMNRCASVKIRSALKGMPGKDIRIIFDGPIAELNPLFCKVGSTYLAFLKKIKDEYYQSTNGSYGIYEAGE